MITAHDFEQKQFELAAEFGLHIFDHPEVDDMLPPVSHVFFQIDSEPEFNEHSRALAERQRQKEPTPVVFVRIKGLAPPQSRLLDPVIEQTSALA